MHRRALRISGGSAWPNPSPSQTKQLPTGVGRFIRVALNILKYDVISDVPTGRAEISSRPESAAPIALADFWELHLDFVGRTPLGALHQIADGDVGRHRDEHVDVIARQHPLDDLNAHFTTDLPDDVPHPLPQFPLQYLVAILGDPHDMIAVVKNRVTAGAVGHILLSKKGPAHPGCAPFFGEKNMKLRLKPVSV